MQPIVYKAPLEPVEVPVTYLDKEYVLVKLSAGDGAKYKNVTHSAIKASSDGRIVGIEGSGDTELLLIELSMREVQDKNGTRVLGKVAKSFVQSLPGVFAMQLFEAARDLNPEAHEKPSREGLLKQINRCRRLLVMLEGEDEAKKLLESSTDSSE